MNHSYHHSHRHYRNHLHTRNNYHLLTHLAGQSIRNLRLWNRRRLETPGNLNLLYHYPLHLYERATPLIDHIQIISKKKH
jgi:hypothetical protein